jgi:hypothetical protein
MKTETITAMILASFVGYFAGGVFEQSAAPPISVSAEMHDNVIKPLHVPIEQLQQNNIRKDKPETDISYLKNTHVLGDKLGVSEETHKKMKFSTEELELINEEAQGQHERLLRDRSTRYKAYTGKRGTSEYAALLDTDSLPPPQSFDAGDKPIIVVNSVNALESLLNDIAVHRKKLHPPSPFHFV